ncbi:NUDIX hydrolase [Pseudolactococcus plantarum]|uniref:ADP-ribose pyrophosphatase n=1 Tax=Pseudolactococcus plantarum TaxID=1365 RepID=A0A2A5S0I0_9LACT|nr:NUDIX hydrolase [Lactococcus plantarum]PCS06963.1 ADP-ribose pyrophosphatase [Lactococcus plantarum]HCN74650.1 NUDIX hydrolase [Lactococcus sp.]
MKFEDFEEKTLCRQDIFKGQVIDVKCDTVTLPNNSGTAKRELVFHNGGVAVLAITNDNKMILVKQFRKALEKVIYEIPAGKLEKGEDVDPQAAMSRELEEETGMSAAKIRKLSAFYTAPGFCNELLHLYKAEELTKLDNPRAQDDDENIELCEVTLAQAKAMVKSGEISDAKTIIAIQYWELETYD